MDTSSTGGQGASVLLEFAGGATLIDTGGENGFWRDRRAFYYGEGRLNARNIIGVIITAILLSFGGTVLVRAAQERREPAEDGPR